MSFYEQHRDLIEEIQRLAPPGMKVEWSGDTLIMQALPKGIHQGNLRKIREQFDANRPGDSVPNEGAELVSPNVGKGRVPDLTYLPEETEESEANSFPAYMALIAIEIASPSNSGNDWMDKLHDYAVMGIPLYLLVDAKQKTVTLFSEPNQLKYHARVDHAFGEKIRIPEPFGFELDLSRLVAY
ncbi:Uma2 family endonuclease [Streptacidiphilus sp. BW17]|uniref:Uma2 family endonuclease n=1 Tax=Streptacidiphilus sp. BW17 TaxID=3156274 RepID=UPI003514A72B